MKISAYTFIHNGVAGGYPFVEAIKMASLFTDEVVVADMDSTDETRQVLEKLNVRIIDGKWMPKTAGECLKYNHSLHTECSHEVIWHFEADEVFDGNLARQVAYEIQEKNHTDIAVYRLQVEQNFQRVRWYPVPVHRIFKNGTAVKFGYTTELHGEQLKYALEHPDEPGMDVVFEIPPEYGYLWDITNCFRDDWIMRIKQQAELWGDEPRYRYVPDHFASAPIECPEGQQSYILSQEHWTWKTCPFDLPQVLQPLVGITSYRQHLEDMGL